jgi:hypothetical protein
VEKMNNKEQIPLEHYLEAYHKADPAEICARTGVAYDEDRRIFRLHYLHRTYEISFPDFEISCLDEKYGYAPLVSSNQSRIMAARFLLEGASATGTGKFLTYREVPWGEVYYRQFNGRCMQRLAFSYGNRLDAFDRACEAIGAEKKAIGDRCYQFEIFPGYLVQFILWSGDDEFPPSSQILFSDNFPAGFHPEDLVVVAEVIIGTLKKSE